jgi:hypothetical protein
LAKVSLGISLGILLSAVVPGNGWRGFIWTPFNQVFMISSKKERRKSDGGIKNTPSGSAGRGKMAELRQGYKAGGREKTYGGRSSPPIGTFLQG